MTIETAKALLEPITVQGQAKADKMARNLFLALDAISSHENPEVRKAALLGAIEKCQSNGMFISGDGVRRILVEEFMR